MKPEQLEKGQILANEIEKCKNDIASARYSQSEKEFDELYINKPMNAENKITKRKTYTITATYYADGTMKLGRLNDGFDALELLGVCHITEVDIKEQVAGNVKADIIERQVMKD